MTDRITFIIFALCILASCSNEDDILRDIDKTAWKAVVTTGETLDAEHHYYTVGLEIEGLALGNVIGISTDTGWLTIKSDTLPSDGLFDVLPEVNTDVEERLAKLTLTNRTDGSTSVVELIQKGCGGENDGPSSIYRIGCGFSCFDDYKCSTSIRGNVISEAGLRQFDSDSTFVSVQEGVRSETYYEFYSAYSLSEMQNKLTKKTSSTTNILGFKKTVDRFSLVSQEATNEQYYGYARMVRVVSSKSMDVGALKYICHNLEILNKNVVNPKERRHPFSDGFNSLYNVIMKDTSRNERTVHIKKMIEQYGTHVIVQTSLGGAIDLAVTYSRNLVTTLDETTESVFKTLIGAKSSSDVNKSVTSSFSEKGAINIYGGSGSARKALRDGVTKLSPTGTNTLPNSELDNWIGSITAHTDDALDAVDFSFIPIWELFPDKTISNEILSVVTSMANEQRNIFSDAKLGVDNYALPLTKEMMEFDSRSTSSFVRVLSSDNVPIAEICNEYVPSVRSDKRITVVYPIVDGVTRITMGLFPGDGENRPAYLSFSGSDVYVNPLDGYGSVDKLDTLYYLHGTLFADNQGVPLRKGRFSTKDHKLQFVGGTNKYPVVKIGSGYWTRTNIKEYMNWGYFDDYYDEFQYVDEMVDGYEFALVYYTQTGSFMDLNSKFYSNHENKNRIRDKWYVPRTKDKNDLTAYLGRNHKSLFTGQQSGFDAQFMGKCTDVDPDKGFQLPNMKQYDKGERCYVVFKNISSISGTIKVTGATILALKPDYTWEEVSETDAKFYYYPVRCFRTGYYNYVKSGI